MEPVTLLRGAAVKACVPEMAARRREAHAIFMVVLVYDAMAIGWIMNRI